MGARILLYPALGNDAPVLCGDWRRSHVRASDAERRWARVLRRRLSVGRGRSFLISTPVTLTARYRLWRLAPAWKTRPVPSRRRLPMVAICAQAACRYHLAEMAKAPLGIGCALAYADRGGMSQADVGAAIGVERQAIQQAEAEILRRASLRSLAGGVAAAKQPKENAEARVLAAVTAGMTAATDIAYETGLHIYTTRWALRELRKRGLVTGEQPRGTHVRIWRPVATSPDRD
jgi:hypothetical protein